jgi:hypothetical protein
MTVAMPDDDQIEALRSLFAHAYEKRQPFFVRVVRAVKDSVGPRTPNKPTILCLNIYEKNDSAKDSRVTQASGFRSASV